MSYLSLKNKTLPLIIFIIGLVLGYHILYSNQQKSTSPNNKKYKKIRTVQVSPLEKKSVVPYWDTSGFVMPAELVNVYSRVSGNIKLINSAAYPGGFVKKGEWLAQVDTADYELELSSDKALLAQAKANLSLVEVEQFLAKEELLLLNDDGALDIDESLFLREPQLNIAKAKILVAKNNVDKAKINLAHSTIKMPFDGKIINKEIGLGSKVTNNTKLFSIVKTDVYWLEVKLPHRFITSLDKKAPVSISQPRLWGENALREGDFISILPELDKTDRQVRVLIAIHNPQNKLKNKPPIYINDFLNVQLKGTPINNAWTIKQSWLQPDNSIWVVDEESKLQKRSVTILFKGRDNVYVDSDIKFGDMALAEKPGIASVGLQVKVKDNSYQTNKTKNEAIEINTGLTRAE